jgi:hypothetical protein
MIIGAELNYDIILISQLQTRGNWNNLMPKLTSEPDKSDDKSKK